MATLRLEERIQVSTVVEISVIDRQTSRLKMSTSAAPHSLMITKSGATMLVSLLSIGKEVLIVTNLFLCLESTVAVHQPRKYCILSHTNTSTGTLEHNSVCELGYQQVFIVIMVLHQL